MDGLTWRGAGRDPDDGHGLTGDDDHRIVYSGADANTTPADTTQPVPISTAGNAGIKDRSFSVPSTRLAPVILVHPNGIATAYIALDGWRPS